MTGIASPAAAWGDALLAAALCAIDPVGTGGLVIKSQPGPVRDRLLDSLRSYLPRSAAFRKVPVHVTEDRLIGGLDLAATLRAGRPICGRGLLSEADGGMVVLAMAERITARTAALIAEAVDWGEVAIERDRITTRSPARFGVVALDEGLAEDEHLPAALGERLAFHANLEGVQSTEAGGPDFDASHIAAARARLPNVAAEETIIHALCKASLAVGIASIRAPMLALRAAKAAAALDQRTVVSKDDAALAARLVFASRASMVPVEEPAASEDGAKDVSPPPAGEQEKDHDDHVSEGDIGEMTDVIVQAAIAAIPPGLLAGLGPDRAGRSCTASNGRAGALRAAAHRGRPVGTRAGDPRTGARLDVIETLKAAATREHRRGDRVQIRRDDFRVIRFKQRSETTTIFVVDASGSAAARRLAEAKGAVELLLADCYLRRDQVAVIAFRGAGAEILLPPTRSLTRAKLSLASLPGGGGTPLAAGITQAWMLADAIRRKGQTPTLVFLTDGRANIGGDGKPGGARAQEEAIAAARRVRAAGFIALLIDTSSQPYAPARRLADEMKARYLPLPHADAAALSQAARSSR
jgi:magnesium chelatase subunit D